MLYDLRSSRATAEEIESAGGEAEMCRVGHSFVKARMREVGAIFAANCRGTSTSGSRRRWSRTTASPRSWRCSTCSRKSRPLSELIAPLRRYSASGEINRRVDAIEPVLAAIEAEHADAAEISHLDGLLRALRRLVVQPAPVEYRARTASQPRGGHAGAHGPRSATRYSQRIGGEIRPIRTRLPIHTRLTAPPGRFPEGPAAPKIEHSLSGECADDATEQNRRNRAFV